MMATPVLSKTQQKKSLSAKKGITKGLKNVLAFPYDNYWPLLKHDPDAELENLLKRLLPALKRTKATIPWTKLCRMNKEERIAVKKTAQTENNINCDKKISESVVLGINAVTRLLEKNNVCCILLDANIDSSVLIKHLIIMAQNKNVPIILISFLKQVTLETIGFASAAIALKKHVEISSENYFFKLFEKILELSLQLSTLKTPKVLFQDKSDMQIDINSDETDVHNMEEDVKEILPSIIKSTDVYLYRTSKKKRIYEPSSSFTEAPKIENKWSDFIALNNDKFEINQKLTTRFFESPTIVNKDINSDNTSNKKTKKTVNKESSMQLDECKINYKPLKVKRLRGNESRLKAAKRPKLKKK